MKIENGQAELSKDEARALLAHISGDFTRQHINSLCVDFAEGAMVATDGHRLTKVNGSPKDPERGQLLISRPDLDRAQKACKGGKNPGTITITPVDDKEAEIAVYNPGENPIRMAVKPVDAQFPPYQQVIPDYPEDQRGEPFGVNPCYMADLSLVSRAATGDKGGAVRVRAAGPLDPILCNVGQDWTVVIMPMRV